MAKGIILGQEPNLSGIENKIEQVDSKFSNYLPLSGGTMLGNLILNGNPTNDNQAVTKKYVDSNSSKLLWTKIDTINGTGSILNKNYNVQKYLILLIVANKAVTNDSSYNHIKAGLNNSTVVLPSTFVSFYANNSRSSYFRDSVCAILKNNIGQSLSIVGPGTTQGYDTALPLATNGTDYLHIVTDSNFTSGSIDVYGLGY